MRAALNVHSAIVHWHVVVICANIIAVHQTIIITIMFLKNIKR